MPQDIVPRPFREFDLGQVPRLDPMHPRPHVGPFRQGRRRFDLLDPLQPGLEACKEFARISCPNLAGVCQLTGGRVIADQESANPIRDRCGSV